MPSDLHIALSIAATPALQERGCVQTIGLEEIRTELGPRWDKRKETVWTHLEGLLGQKLSPTDYYTRIDETSFLVSMPTAHADEAQIFCLRIAHALHESLLGPCESKRLCVARVTAIHDEPSRPSRWKAWRWRCWPTAQACSRQARSASIVNRRRMAVPPCPCRP